MKLTGALGETTSKAAGVLAAGVTTAVGSTQQRVSDLRIVLDLQAALLHVYVCSQEAAVPSYAMMLPAGCVRAMVTQERMHG